ncbi:MAG: glycerol dehydrogenase [Syntrophus sp. (in: bacteria)]|nr:glycerol dehydrogenase [Syntrophus sp. (in: bacteria)]
MENPGTFDPNATYQKLPDDKKPIQLFISPSQYIQGRGVINLLGEYLSLCASGCTGVLITPGRDRALGNIVDNSLNTTGFTVKKMIFQGESTLEEVKRVVSFFKGIGPEVNVIIGIGGGKCLDTARMAASRLGVPAVTIPTTASTDAPTAAHSVVYDKKGVFSNVEFSATNPLMVLVDLDIIAAAPPRYIVAGMGDAFSTFYEARCCMENPEARTARGARPTMAALAIARQCRDLLLNYGTTALDEVRNRRTGDALAHIVEANILLSGLGFESGGLAGAHGVAQGLTACSDLHINCLHGELVAIGTMTQLIMEKRMDEANQAARFFKDVGLPLHLAQLGFDPLQQGAELDNIVQRSLNVFFIRYEPYEITHGFLKAAILEANEFGKAMERELTK